MSYYWFNKQENLQKAKKTCSREKLFTKQRNHKKKSKRSL